MSEHAVHARVAGRGGAASASVSRRRLSAAVALGALSALAGCVSLGGDGPARQWYRIDDPGATGPVAEPPIARALLIEGVASGAFHDGTALVFGQPGVRAHYQFAAWAERPTRRLAQLVERRLDGRRRLAAVAQSTAGVRGDLLLRLALDDLYHDVTRPPGEACVGITAELVDWRARVLLGRRVFEHRAPVAEPSAAAAATATSLAVGALLDALAPWVESLAAASVRPGAPAG